MDVGKKPPPPHTHPQHILHSNDIVKPPQLKDVRLKLEKILQNILASECSLCKHQVAQ